MQVMVGNEDRVVVVDGLALNFDFTLDDNIWAIQWNGTEGEVEYNDGTPNWHITDFTSFQYLVDAHSAEKARQEQEVLDAIANRTYSEKREAEYPPATDYLDGIVKGDTAQVDKYIADCQAVKDKYPKD